jgi:hypothetical protein
MNQGKIASLHFSENGNKMQKTIYRVRTQEHIVNRIALDMVRDSQKSGRCGTLETLHRQREA